MITGDTRKWAESTKEEIEKIATSIWAKKFTYKQLRQFQKNYTRSIEVLSAGNNPDKEILLVCLEHLMDTATRAIDFQCFGD